MNHNMICSGWNKEVNTFAEYVYSRQSRHFEDRGKTRLQCLTCGQRLEIANRNARNALFLPVTSHFSGFDRRLPLENIERFE